MRYVVLVFSLMVVGCSDSPADLIPLVPDLSIVSGDLQSGRVTEELPDSLTVVARAGSEPVPGQYVCWIAVTDGAGQADEPCAGTDDEGRLSTAWQVGTVAGTHTVEARAVVRGKTVAVATYDFEAAPGPVHVNSVPNDDAWPIPRSFPLGTPYLVPEDAFLDAHGNSIPFDVELVEAQAVTVVRDSGVGLLHDSDALSGQADIYFVRADDYGGPLAWRRAFTTRSGERWELSIHAGYVSTAR